jgi:hypothetical protein
MTTGLAENVCGSCLDASALGALPPASFGVLRRRRTPKKSDGMTMAISLPSALSRSSRMRNLLSFSNAETCDSKSPCLFCPPPATPAARSKILKADAT